MDVRYADEEMVRSAIKDLTKNADRDIDMLNRGSVIKTPDFIIKRAFDYGKFISKKK